MVESVYSAVRTDSLYKADYVSSLKGKLQRRGPIVRPIHRNEPWVGQAHKLIAHVCGPSLLIPFKA